MDPSQLLQVGGATVGLVVAFQVLRWIVDGRLHANSEVQGLRDDKKELFLVNQRLARALDTSNAQLVDAYRLIREQAAGAGATPAETGADRGPFTAPRSRSHAGGSLLGGNSAEEHRDPA